MGVTLISMALITAGILPIQSDTVAKVPLWTKKKNFGWHTGQKNGQRKSGSQIGVKVTRALNE